MPRLRLLLCTVILSLIPNRSDCIKGHYWREFSGKIPADALVAGKDLNGGNVYIGQAYIKGAGLIVVELKQGTKEVAASYAGTQRTDKNIKVLCGSPESSEWVTTNAARFQANVAGKVPVIGGQEDINGYMNIGRVFWGNKTRVGKVNSYWTENAKFYFVDHDGVEKWLENFDVLVYKDEAPPNNADFNIGDFFSG